MALDRKDPSVGWHCVQCVGGTIQGRTFNASPALKESRGDCTGCFTSTVEGARRDDDGLYVTGSTVVNHPSLDGVKWRRCPLALTAQPLCPSPAVPGWLREVFETANWMNQGGSVGDFIEGTTTAFKGAVSTVRAAWSQAREESRATEPKGIDLIGMMKRAPSRTRG